MVRLVGFAGALGIAALACGRTGLEVGAENEDGTGAGFVSVVTSGSQGVGGGSGGSGEGGVTSTGGGGGNGGEAGSGNGVLGWVNSRTQLYVLEDDFTPTLVGDLAGCFGDALDIAVDELGVLYVSTPGALYRVDGATGACTLLHEGSYPNSLAVTPPGTIDPSATTLVGVETDTYVRMDKASGAQVVLGTLGTTEFYSSGDVALHEGRMYLSISGGSCFDCLAEIDRRTGLLQNLIGPIGFTKVFGLLSWDGSLYGFTNEGDVLRIDTATGAGTGVNDFSIEFWGAARYP